MKSFKSLMESLAEAWPGTPEYKKKFGSPSDDGSEGSRHKIDRSAGITRATRKYDAESGESEEPTKNREDAAAAPVKRGRGRPPGKYGSYKKKVKESIEILEALETDEEIEEFVFSLDEESFAELEQYLSEEQIDEAATPVKTTPGISVKKEKGHTRAITTHHVVDGQHYKVTSQHDGDDGLHHDIHKVSGKKETRVHGSYTYGVGGYDSPPKSHREGSLDKKVASSLYSAHNKERKKKVHGDEGKHPHELHDDDDFYESFMVGQEYEKQIDEEALKGAMHPAAAKVLKHIKPEHHGTYKPYLKQGVYKGGYSDRAAVLSAAEKAGHIKEDEEVAEALKHPNHKVLDKNKNNKLDREDFAILRGEKKAPVKEEIGLAEGSGPKEKQHDKYVDRNSPAAQAKVQAAKDRMAAEKKAEAGKKLLAKLKEEVSEEKVADIAAFITKQAKGEA